MKTKAKLYLLSLGAALTCGVVSASIFSSGSKVLETSAADLSVFGKEVCEITIGSSGYTASPNVLENNKIVNSSYVYSIKMASGVTSSPHFPAINYSSEYEGSPIYDIVLNNVSIQSGNWSSSCSIENKHLDKQLVVNWYCEGSNYIKGHNWNAIVMRNNGNGRIVFSTLTGGNFIAQDSYNNCPPKITPYGLSLVKLTIKLTLCSFKYAGM